MQNSEAHIYIFTHAFILYWISANSSNGNKNNNDIISPFSTLLCAKMLGKSEMEWSFSSFFSSSSRKCVCLRTLSTYLSIYSHHYQISFFSLVACDEHITLFGFVHTTYIPLFQFIHTMTTAHNEIGYMAMINDDIECARLFMNPTIPCVRVSLHSGMCAVFLVDWRSHRKKTTSKQQCK